MVRNVWWLTSPGNPSTGSGFHTLSELLRQPFWHECQKWSPANSASAALISFPCPNQQSTLCSLPCATHLICCSPFCFLIVLPIQSAALLFTPCLMCHCAACLLCSCVLYIEAAHATCGHACWRLATPGLEKGRDKFWNFAPEKLHDSFCHVSTCDVPDEPYLFKGWVSNKCIPYEGTSAFRQGLVLLLNASQIYVNKLEWK